MALTNVMLLCSCFHHSTVRYTCAMLVFIDGENFKQRLAGILKEEGLVIRDDFFNYDLAGLLRDILATRDVDVLYYSSEVRAPIGYTPDETLPERLEIIKKDICPVYHKLRRYGVSIKYVCFAKSVNRAVSAATNKTVTITNQKAVEYFIDNDKA